jgi:L-seryl-tRNA(Ser) seleniumtransferase
MDRDDALRRLPAVGRLLDDEAFSDLLVRYGRGLTADLLRDEIERLRVRVLADSGPSRMPDPAALAKLVTAAADAILAPSPRRVINATGVVAHTNLGRSILSPEAARRVAEAASGYLDLEYDLGTGSRGDRMAHLAPLLARLFPGSAALVVNNNAGAIFLALHALAARREVVISRGELVEIGGSFRVPDILRAAGSTMREVGTTNRTRVADYEEAIGPKTAMLLKVHASNFKVVGFTEEASIEELSVLARAKGIPLVVDWGSGDLVDLGPAGIHDEVPVRALLDRGADLVTFSGDKLLGGPQAGLIVGREDLVKRLRRDPLARVLRLDRLQIAALRETLQSYLRGRAMDEVPTLRMLAATAASIGARAESLAQSLHSRVPGLAVTIIDGVSRPGGGSSPAGEIPTKLLAIEAKDAAAFERRLRRGEPPVVARVQEGRVLLDLRTVQEDEDAILAERIIAAAGTV